MNFRELDPRVIRGVERLRPHWQQVGDDGIIIDDGREVRVFTAPVGMWEGHRRCGKCKHGFTEERPCQHIATDLVMRGTWKPDTRLDELMAGDGFGVQLTNTEYDLFCRVRGKWMDKFFAERLAAAPDEWFEGFSFTGGRQAVDVRAACYATYVWVTRHLSMKGAVQELADNHRDNLATLGFHVPIQYDVISGDHVLRPPFSHNIIWEFLAHAKTRDLQEKLLAFDGVMVREFEDLAVMDGTAFSAQWFGMYCDDLDEVRDVKERVLKMQEAGDTLPVGIAGLIEVQPNRDDKEGKEQRKGRQRRKRKYLMVIIMAGYRTGVVYSCLPGIPAGPESPYGVAMAERSRIVKVMDAYVQDLGYYKSAFAYWAQEYNSYVYLDFKDGTTTRLTGSDCPAAKKALVQMQDLLRARPDLAKQLLGIRQKIESLNAMHLRILGASLRCRGPLVQPRKQRPSKRGLRRLLDATRTEYDSGLSMSNETLMHYLALNAYNLAKWAIVLGSAHKVNPALRYDMWTPQGQPNFLAARNVVKEWPEWRPMSSLLGRYTGPNRTIVTAIDEDVAVAAA